ncbi:MAG: Re/Si-specific NAD(P)(+) transhydrogenase subunit alpha [Planctomycetes bacterium]|nr:Re/Si-specific NAD(P)(+) transhydrogenase subunit alpha [Planctomycetota bacterium]
MATIFIPKETTAGERRVAATPDTVKKLVKDGHAVSVQLGAGLGAFYPDQEYIDAGATIEPEAAKGWGTADIVAQFNVPSEDAVRQMKEGATVISFIWAFDNLRLVETLAARKISAFAMDAVPRTTRAQKDDALTSQASLAGYKAVLLAAANLPKILPMQMTAAGTLRPAKIVIIGAGVAGLQAIATAKRLGAIVEVSDVRPEVKEQVQSLGAVYIEVKTDENLSAVGGYAKEQSEDFKKKQAEVLREHLIAADAIITTALIPYRPAPKLIAAEIVQNMRPGSVIVDLAAERGGNCELTESGKTVVKNGVTIIGELALANTLPVHASEQYAKNVQNVLSDATKKGVFAWDLKDDIVGGGKTKDGQAFPGGLITHAGEVLHPKVREAMKLPPLVPKEEPKPAEAPKAPEPAKA